VTDRTAFLARIRERLADGAPANLPHPIEPIDGVPRIDYRRDLSDPVDAFTQAAGRVGTNVRRTDDAGELVAEVVAAHAIRTAALSREPECEGLAQRLRGAGIEIVEDLSRADLGVTGAAWGIAATGSVVVDASRAGGRSVSLLPEVHLALLRADRILPQAGDLFRSLDERFDGGPPSQFVLITGPSKSGDIELEITMGVHGPRTVWVGIVG